MDLLEKQKQIRERVKKTKLFFSNYLENKGYEFVYKERVMEKGFVSISFMTGGSRVRIYDNNREHKFTFISLCLTPKTKEEADNIYDILELEKKEIGTKAWKEKYNKR